jgi:hypothetical protein
MNFRLLIYRYDVRKKEQGKGKGGKQLNEIEGFAPRSLREFV